MQLFEVKGEGMGWTLQDRGGKEHYNQRDEGERRSIKRAEQSRAISRSAASAIVQSCNGHDLVIYPSLYPSVCLSVLSPIPFIYPFPFLISPFLTPSHYSANFHEAKAASLQISISHSHILQFPPFFPFLCFSSFHRFCLFLSCVVRTVPNSKTMIQLMKFIEKKTDKDKKFQQK